jgi:hypothetical protein
MTNPDTQIEPETADLLNQIAESENVSPDSLLRRMLLRYTSIELRQATADIQQIVSTPTPTEDTTTTSSDPPLCPYCDFPVSSTSNSNRNSTSTVSISSIYRCEDRYCPLGMFVETNVETEQGDLRLLTEIIDNSDERDTYDI